METKIPAQNWTAFQDAFTRRDFLEKLDESCHKFGKQADLAFLNAELVECEHNKLLKTVYAPVSENLAISETYCARCGKILSFDWKRILPTFLFKIEGQIESENKNGVDVNE